MLKILRKEGVMKTLLWIVAVVIVLSFGIFSNAYLLSDRNTKIKYAGRIFGEKVQIKDFLNQLEFLDAYYMITIPNYEQLRPQVNLEDRTWERLILLHEARKENVSVKDEEVISYIKTLFASKGAFNPGWYKTVLQRLSLTAPQFEHGLRQTLEIEKLFELKTLGSSVSDEEVLNAYTQQNEQVQIVYALFPTADFLIKMEKNDIAVKSFFIDHKSDFIQPPSIQVHYLAFTTPTEPASSAAAEDPYALALKAADRILQGESIYSVAQSLNTPVEETGFFNMNNANIKLGWSLDTIQRLYQMQPLEGVEFVPTDSGYQLLQIKAKKDAYLPAFEEVNQEATQSWEEAQAKNLAKEEAIAKRLVIIEFLKQNPAQTFQEAASSSGVFAQESPVFKRNDYLPNLGMASELQEAAFPLNEQSISEAIETPTGYAFFKVLKHIPIDPDAFEKESMILRSELLRKKQTAVFNAYLTNVLSKANLEDVISDWMKKKN